MNDIQRLCVAQALYKAIASAVKTRTPGNLRAVLDDDLRRLYEQTGAKSFDIKDDYGTKIATASSTVKGGWEVTDPDAFDAWRRESGFLADRQVIDWGVLTDEQEEAVERFALSICPGAAVKVQTEVEDWTGAVSRSGALAIDSDGCVVPGVEWREGVVSTALRVDPQAVAASVSRMGGASLADILADPAPFAPLPAPAPELEGEVDLYAK